MKSYRVVVAPQWYRGTRFGNGLRYAYEHHVVAEKMLGRPLNHNEVVHHRDEDRRNNRRSNLKVQTRSAHARHHAPNPSPKVKLICSECKKGFVTTTRLFKKRVRQGNKNFYCGRVCMGRRQGRDNKGKSGRKTKLGG